MKSPHVILGIPPRANKTRVKEAYFRLAKQYHPDLYQGDKSVGAEKFKQVHTAYETMMRAAPPEVTEKPNIYRVVDSYFDPQLNMNCINIMVSDEIATVGAHVFTIVSGYGDVNFDMPAGTKHGQFIMANRSNTPSHKPLRINFIISLNEGSF